MKRSRGNKFADAFYIVRKVVCMLLICVAVLAGLVLVVSRIVASIGESHLREDTKGQFPSLTIAEESSSEAESGAPSADTAPEQAVVWKEGWVRYEDKIYEYNQDILTFLCLGIDKQEKVRASKGTTDGGQSDAIFLVVANPDEKEISLIGVNRDTIVDVLMVGVGKNGEDVVFPSQIAVQHGFGDGMEESCELTKARVSELFFDLPIHAYASFNMGGIAALNDALGGVEITMTEDWTALNKAWTKGAEVTLKGKDAYTFVQKRDTSVFESARGRLGRQKQYIKAFATKAIAGVKKDVTLPVKLYNNFKDYLITDLTVDEIAYLAQELSGYHINSEIYTLEGETHMKGEHEGFYPDEEALKALLIEVFYREIAVE